MTRGGGSKSMHLWALGTVRNVACHAKLSCDRNSTCKNCWDLHLLNRRFRWVQHTGEAYLANSLQKGFQNQVLHQNWQWNLFLLVDLDSVWAMIVSIFPEQNRTFPVSSGNRWLFTVFWSCPLHTHYTHSHDMSGFCASSRPSGILPEFMFTFL